MSKKTIRVHHPAPSVEEMAKYIAERRRRDRVTELTQGFTSRPDGQTGYVYYREGEQILELMWEIAGEGADIIVFLRGLQKWFAPNEQAVDLEKQKALKQALRDWLNGNGVRAIFEENR
jgi:hypothetical protein